jgi:uncharacterized YigZ family protein
LTLQDEYLTLAGPGSSETRVKGSRFIASAAFVQSETGAGEFIERTVRRYHDATHNCYAYRVGIGDRAIIRHSDAGDPSGTAGRPILEAILARNLTDAVVLVTRYFGGTKLGTGGLARAYRECAGKALDSAGTVRKLLAQEFHLRFPYELTRGVRKVIVQYQARIVDQQYGETVEFSISIRQSKAEALREELQIMGRGRVEIV